MRTVAQEDRPAVEPHVIAFPPSTAIRIEVIVQDRRGATERFKVQASSLWS